MTTWQLAGSIVLGLEIAGLVVGLLLRFRAGRWLLAVLFIASLFDGHADSSSLDADTPLHKVSRFLLIAGGSCVAIAVLIRRFLAPVS